MSKVIPSMDSATKDIVQDNISQLKQLFPEVFTEGKVDFDTLREVLGEHVENREERYSFTWNGKNQARRLAQTPSTGTLRPCKEESVDWDSTENLFIEGDNLEVLKLLQKSYYKKVKMIYIDPPYNTGNDFVYKDNFSDNIKNYKEITGQVDEGGRPYSDNPETSGRYHTNWLNMMYPRLKLAKNLLKDDGVIIISIDDNEVSNLKRICDEIFGEENFIDLIVWDKKSSAKGVPPRNMLVNVHEYLVAYQKSDSFRFIGEKRDEEKDGFKNPDNDPRGPWRESNIKSTTKTIDKSFTITDPNTGATYTNTWAFSQESLERMISEGRILWKEKLPKQKEFMHEMTNENKAIKSSWGVFDPQKSTVYLKKLMPEVHFENPKPLSLISRLLEVSLENNSLVLDLFAGSSTTAHAVFLLNAKEKRMLKFIMVQLPEIISKYTEDDKVVLQNIAEISKELGFVKGFAQFVFYVLNWLVWPTD